MPEGFARMALNATASLRRLRRAPTARGAKLAPATLISATLILAASGPLTQTRAEQPTGWFVADIVTRGAAPGSQRVIVRAVQADQEGANAALMAQLVRLFAQKSRLEAILAKSERIVFPAGFETSSQAARAAAEGESRLLLAKRVVDDNLKAQHRERIKQLRAEIDSLKAQRDAKRREIELLRRELQLVQDLHKRQLTNEVRLIGMQREVARYEGEDAALAAQIARAHSQIAEIELQISAIDHAAMVEAQRELRDVDTELQALLQRASETIGATANENAEAQEPLAPVAYSARPAGPPAPAATEPKELAVAVVVCPPAHAASKTTAAACRKASWRDRAETQRRQGRSYGYRRPRYAGASPVRPIIRTVRRALRLRF